MRIKDGWLAQVKNADITDGVFVIPDDVQEISDGVFQKCRSPRKIIFSAGTTYYAGFHWPFAFCHELERIEVDAHNQEFCAEDGILFDREKTRLFCCPVKWPGSRYRIPDTVTAIDNCAFRGCSGLEEVIIPPEVRFIGDWAFDGCTGLKRIQLPSGLKSLCDYSFRNCASLSEVVVPKSVKSIGKGVFEGCTSLNQASRSAIVAIQAKTIL